MSSIRQFTLCFPSLPEQQKIASFLTAVDTKIQQLTRKKELLEQYKKGVMQQLFSQQIRFKDEEGKDFPDWEEKRLEEVADGNIRWSFTGGPFGSNLKAEEYTETGVRIIQLQNIGDGKFIDKYRIYTSSLKADELLSCNIYPGEIILSKMGDPVARACFIPYIEDRYLMASDGIRLVVDEEKFNKKYILEAINSPSFRKKAISVSTGSTRKRIGLSELRQLKLLVPNFAEQKKIADFLASIDQKINHVEIYQIGALAFKKGLLQQMFV